MGSHQSRRAVGIEDHPGREARQTWSAEGVHLDTRPATTENNPRSTTELPLTYSEEDTPIPNETEGHTSERNRRTPILPRDQILSEVPSTNLLDQLKMTNATDDSKTDDDQEPIQPSEGVQTEGTVFFPMRPGCRRTDRGYIQARLSWIAEETERLAEAGRLVVPGAAIIRYADPSTNAVFVPH